MTTDSYMTTESTSKVHGHWPVKYAVANIKDRGKSIYRLSPLVVHAESSAILTAEGFLLYLYGPLSVTLLRVAQ